MKAEYEKEYEYEVLKAKYYKLVEKHARVVDMYVAAIDKYVAVVDKLNRPLIAPMAPPPKRY